MADDYDPFADNWQFQGQFRDHFLEIARYVIRVVQASWHLDVEEGVDFVTLSTPEKKLTARARRHNYNAPPHTYRFTIRHDLPSGAQTEWDKIRAGHADFGMYGIQSQEGSDRLSPWMVYDLDVLRDYLDHGGPWRLKHNKRDGVGYAEFQVDQIILPGFLQAYEGLEEISLPDSDQDLLWCSRCGRVGGEHHEDSQWCRAFQLENWIHPLYFGW